MRVRVVVRIPCRRISLRTSGRRGGLRRGLWGRANAGRGGRDRVLQNVSKGKGQVEEGSGGLGWEYETEAEVKRR